VEAATGLAVRATIPRFRSAGLGSPVRGHAIPLRDAPDHAASEAFRSLAAGLGADLPPRGALLGVTSTRRGEGRTTANVDLALALAQSGRRTLLVDVDLRKPLAHAQLGAPAAPGLAEHLQSGEDWRDLVHETPHADLYVLPAGTRSRPPGELLAGPPLRDLLEELRGEFDAIVLDLPPAAGIADVHLLAGRLDALLLLCRLGAVRRDDLVACTEGLRRGGASLVGAIANG
jgi:capsular exopolysaccharide synthesis family protein